MRVCPKCGYIDPPYWKHTKWSYYIDGCTFENFKILKPDLAKKLRGGGDITEDKNYLYRLTKTKLVVLRKAKVDFADLEKLFSAEKYEKGSRRKVFLSGAKAKHRIWKLPPDYYPHWSKLHPHQKKLLEK